MSINLEEIVERAVPLSQGHYLAVRAEDFNALVAEVERLREGDVIARSCETTLSVEVEHLREEVHTMRRWAEEAAHAENLNALDAQKERAAVVAWLRNECGSPGHEDRFCAYCNVRRNIAADIESGEHRREEEP